MFQLPFEQQRELIGEGVKLFSDLNGKAPKAYRAGCYGASEITLCALRKNGVTIDSSYNLAYLGQTCGFQTPLLNAPMMIQGVCEFPVTVFRVPGSAGYKPLEISAVSVAEILQTIRSLQEIGCRDAVLSLHSFSLMKNLGTRFENYRPDHIVIQRLRKLCSSLSELKEEVDVVVLGDVEMDCVSGTQPQVVPSAGWVRPAMRKNCPGGESIALVVTVVFRIRESQCGSSYET